MDESVGEVIFFSVLNGLWQGFLVLWPIFLLLVMVAIIIGLVRRKRTPSYSMPMTSIGWLRLLLKLIIPEGLKLLRQKGGVNGLVGSAFEYRRKEYFMTKAEHEFFDVLMSIVGNKYYVFPQVHLDSLFDQHVKGQSWQGALSHIQRKSVDFVVCDKANIRPLLAIELDDASHEREERMVRDAEMERIFAQAQLPLLRFENHGQFNRDEIASRLSGVLNPVVSPVPPSQGPSVINSHPQRA